jgi:hypothetical protein
MRTAFQPDFRIIIVTVRLSHGLHRSSYFILEAYLAGRDSGKKPFKKLLIDGMMQRQTSK